MSKSKPKKHIAIFGAGVNGLSCAISLLQLKDRPYSVTVFAESFGDDTTSAGAPALWTPVWAKPVDKILKWSDYTRKKLLEMHENKNDPWPIGVGPVSWCIGKTIVEEEIYFKSIVPDFKVEQDKDGLYYAKYQAPFIQSSPYIEKQMNLLKTLGCHFVQCHIRNVAEFIHSEMPNVDLIINCLGVGSKDVFNDGLTISVRGVVVRLNPLFPPNHNHTSDKRIEKGNSFFAIVDTTNTEGVAYIISRPDLLYLGGTYQVGSTSKEIKEEDKKSIISRCTRLMPEINKDNDIQKKVFDSWAGFRPVRATIRLEMDKTHQVPVVHCYGHGGSGWTTHLGCALDVTELVNQHFNPSKL
eukprot:TRINITY_DN3391_c0_g1_i1.p1 TRINITY_DN3391_c0_g1~~TRINITY_DN3391_c0_g1_i1.p1  ORF type:complete len:355 (-),score=44.73 TRINITY_DN3391_c0_g1_i1:45-1109(-)